MLLHIFFERCKKIELWFTILSLFICTKMMYGFISDGSQKVDVTDAFTSVSRKSIVLELLLFDYETFAQLVFRN